MKKIRLLRHGDSKCSGGLYLQLGYNFLYSLWRYQWDADCELFLKVLTGDIKEEVYVAQNNLQIDLEELFECLDKAAGQTAGMIPKVCDIFFTEYFNSANHEIDANL